MWRSTLKFPLFTFMISGDSKYSLTPLQAFCSSFIYSWKLNLDQSLVNMNNSIFISSFMKKTSGVWCFFCVQCSFAEFYMSRSFISIIRIEQYIIRSTNVISFHSDKHWFFSVGKLEEWLKIYLLWSESREGVQCTVPFPLLRQMWCSCKFQTCDASKRTF